MKRRNKKEDISRHLLLQQQKMTVGYGSDQDRLATALPLWTQFHHFPNSSSRPKSSSLLGLQKAPAPLCHPMNLTVPNLWLGVQHLLPSVTGELNPLSDATCIVEVVVFPACIESVAEFTVSEKGYFSVDSETGSCVLFIMKLSLVEPPLE